MDYIDQLLDSDLWRTCGLDHLISMKVVEKVVAVDPLDNRTISLA